MGEEGAGVHLLQNSADGRRVEVERCWLAFCGRLMIHSSEGQADYNFCPLAPTDVRSRQGEEEGLTGDSKGLGEMGVGWGVGMEGGGGGRGDQHYAGSCATAPLLWPRTN